MASIALYKRGYAVENTPRSLPEFKGGGKRGKLTGKVSSASFRRMRVWCITHDCDASCWGVTLTVPGLDIIPVAEFKALHHKLCVFCNDRSIPCIWRVELQRRGQPHLHLVVFGDVENAVFIMSHWYKLLDSCPGVFSPEFVAPRCKEIVSISRSFVHGSNHAVDLQALTGDFRAFRYLVAHMSKGKVEQLGWAGRNWGVCNKALFHFVDPENIGLTDRQYFCLRRWINRLRTGKRHRHVVLGCSFNLGNPDVIKDMYDFMVSDIGFCEDVPVYSRPAHKKIHFVNTYAFLSIISSIPESYVNQFYDGLSADVHKLLLDIYLAYLKMLLWYGGNCLNSLDCASSLSERKELKSFDCSSTSRQREVLKMLDRRFFVFPKGVETSKEKIDWYLSRVVGEQGGEV